MRPTGPSQWESGSPEGSPWHQSISPATAASPAWTDPSPAGYPPGLGFGPPSAPYQPDPTPAPPMDPDAWEVSDAWDEDDKEPDQAPARAVTAAPWLMPANYGAAAPAASAAAPALAGDGDAWDDDGRRAGGAYAAPNQAQQQRRAPWQATLAQPALAAPPGLGPGASPVNPRASGPAAPWLAATAATAPPQPWAAERQARALNVAQWAPGGAAQASQLHSAAEAAGTLGYDKPYRGYGAAVGYDGVRQHAALAAPPPDLLMGAAGRDPALPLPMRMPGSEGAGYPGARAPAGAQTLGAGHPSAGMAGAAGAQGWGTGGFAARVGPGSAERPAVCGYGAMPAAPPGGVGFREQGAAPPLPNMDIESDDEFDFGAPPLPEVQSHAT